MLNGSLAPSSLDEGHMLYKRLLQSIDSDSLPAGDPSAKLPAVGPLTDADCFFRHTTLLDDPCAWSNCC